MFAPRTPLLRALSLSIPIWAALIALWIGNPKGNFWLTIEPPKAQCEAYDPAALITATHLDYTIYAPAKIDRLLREPQNTLSNLPYAIAGLAIMLAARRPASQGLGLALIFLGFGSGMYHASLLPEWRMIDILGVYAVLYLMVWIGVTHHFPKITSQRITASLGTLLVWAGAIWTGIHRNDVRLAGIKVFDSTYVFVTAVTIGCALLALVYWRAVAIRRLLHRPLGLLLIAAPLSFTGGVGDRFGGYWADPEAWIQGHTVWHALGAVALWAAYEVYAAAGFDHSTCSPTNLRSAHGLRDRDPAP